MLPIGRFVVQADWLGLKVGSCLCAVFTCITWTLTMAVPPWTQSFVLVQVGWSVNMHRQQGVDPARVGGSGPSWNFASEGPPLFGPSQNFTESSHLWSTVMKHSEHNLSQYHFQSSVYCQMRISKPRIMHTVRIHLELLSSAVSEQFHNGLSAAI